MSFVIGRGDDRASGPTARLGSYRALDGSEGAPLEIDLDGPHAVLIVGKRGYGKSYTMGVLAEGLARADGVAPILVDPMGVFDTLAASPATADVPARVLDDPIVAPASLDARSWCALLGLDPESGVGGLVWQAAADEATLAGMCDHVEDAGAPTVDRRSAINHLRLAESWGVFDADGVGATEVGGPEVTVVDVSDLEAPPMNAVCRGLAEALYRARSVGTMDRLPWLLLDEAHAFFDGVAGQALHKLLTRGRAPGVSVVAATQRPSAVPAVGISQSDVLIAHRLTSRADLAALEDAQPTYVGGSLTGAQRLPESPGEVLVVDDATETVHSATVRRRRTPHGGDSPRASDVDAAD